MLMNGRESEHSGLSLGGNSDGEDENNNENMLEDGQCRSFIHRFGGAGGFHLHAVVAVTEDIFREQHNDGHNTPPSTSTSSSSSCIHCCKHSSRKGWIMAIGSLCLITTQILILNWMITEVTLPRCSMHTDCNIGQYCEQKVKMMPRCWDCYQVTYVEEEADVLRKCKSNYEYYKNIRDDVTVWVSRKNIWHPKSLMNYTAVLCLKYLHCLQTDIGDEDDSRINDDFYVSNDAMGAETEMWPYEELWPYKDEEYAKNTIQAVITQK